LSKITYMYANYIRIYILYVRVIIADRAI
jgi:hypothetical protein